MGLGLVLVLIALNGMFVAGEFSLLAVDTSRVDVLADGGSRRARGVRALLRKLSFHLGGAQLGITLTSLMLGIIAEGTVGELLKWSLGGFVALEFGLIGGKRAAIDAMAAAGRKSAVAAQRMQGDVLTTLGGAQLGITLCSMAVGRLTEPALAKLIEGAIGSYVELSDSTLHSVGFAVGLGIVVVIHMVMGEMVPKNLALVGPERTLLILARPMAAYLVVARPVVRGLLAVSNLLLRAVRVEPVSELHDTASAAELSLMARDSHAEGHIDAEDVTLLDRALSFGNTSAIDVMAPVDDASVARPDDTTDAICAKFSRTRSARMAVIGDGVIGMIHGNDLAGLGSESGDDGHRWDGLIRDALVLDASDDLDMVLERMNGSRTHLGIVVDAEAEPIGVVTMDAVLERLISDPTSA